MLEITITLLLTILSITMLIYIFLTKDIIVAAIGTALISLFASILFLIMKAPDVAMTEAAIGAALSGAIIIGVIIKIKREHR